MNDKRMTMHPISLGRAMRRGFRALYDNLGYVVFASFLTFLVTAALSSAAVAVARAAGLGMAGLMLLLPAVLAAYLLAVGVFYYANKVVFHEHPVLADTWAGIRALMGPALKLFVADLAITAVLVGDTAFFLSAYAGSRSHLFGVLGIVSGYLTLVWLMMAMYHLPLLVAQMKMESGPGTLVIYRKSYLLLADNPVFTLGAFLVIIAFAVLCALPALIGTAMLSLGGASFLLTHVLRELFVKYEIAEEEPEVVSEDRWSLPESWRKRQSRETENTVETGGWTND